MKMEQRIIEDASLRRLSVNEMELKEFGPFCEAHQDCLQALVKDFDSWASFT
jgi:hypothetical protein